jgi:hypothetical protein
LAIWTYTLLLQPGPPNASAEEVQPVGAQGISAGIGLYVPAPHAAHTADVSPSPELYEPARHVVDRQTVAPEVATYLAWVHSEQVLAPPLEMVPATHATQTEALEALTVPEYVPAPHCEHASGLNMPVPVPYVPAMQMAQDNVPSAAVCL